MMRFIEIILKLAFLLGAIYIFAIGWVALTFSLAFISVAILLGICLLFNKEASYNFPQTKRDLLLRRIEGIVLIVAAIAGLIFLCSQTYA